MELSKDLRKRLSANNGENIEFTTISHPHHCTLNPKLSGTLLHGTENVPRQNTPVNLQVLYAYFSPGLFNSMKIIFFHNCPFLSLKAHSKTKIFSYILPSVAELQPLWQQPNKNTQIVVRYLHLSAKSLKF